MPGAPEYIEGEAEAVNDVFVNNIQATISNATEALTDLTESTKAYTEDLTFKKAVEDAKAALSDLLEKAKLLKDDAAEIPMKALSRAIVVANSAIEKLKKLAKEFDEKNQVSKTISDGVSKALDSCSVSIAEVSHYTTEAASATHAHLQGVNDVIRERVASTANRGLSFLLNTFAEIDVKYDVRGKAKENMAKLDEKFGIQDKASALNKKYDISETAKEKGEVLAEKAPGPILSSYEKGLKFATDGLEYISEEFEKARLTKKREAIETELAEKAKAAAAEVKAATNVQE